jgi:hypothetical protein
MSVGFCSGAVLLVEVKEICYDDLKVENVQEKVL